MAICIKLTIRKVLAACASLVLVIGGNGCQTFSMSEEHFYEQQMGRYDNDSQGAAVVESIGKALARSWNPSH
jgi:hypothetical protein